MNTHKLSIVSVLAFASFAVLTANAAEKYLPFVLASNTEGSISDKVEASKKSLQTNGFQLAGEYSPYESAYIVVVTNNELKKAAASHPRGGYVAAQRISFTALQGKEQETYTNPFYMAKAYQIQAGLEATTTALKKALGFVQFFGPDEGLSERNLGKYHYTFGMEYFNEPIELATKGSYSQAVSEIEKNLAAKKGGAVKVYRIDIPGTSQTLFGVGMKAPNEGKKYMDDKFIMSEIDYKPIRSTAHLPYEILVNGKETEALHARFRIAINFPDLSMMGDNSFMNIMSTPDAIEDVLTQIAGGVSEDDDF